MGHDGTEQNDALKKIRNLLDERGWSLYKLSQASEVPYSSLCNMFNRNTQPSIYNLDKICTGFGISLSDFFNTPSIPRPDTYILDDDEVSVIKTFRDLPRDKKNLLKIYAYGLAGKPLPEK